MENIEDNFNKNLNKKNDYENYIFLLNQRENIEKIEKDHRDVIQFIENANKNEPQEIFIPVCDDFAYFIGKIKNPKECKVYLGEEYFLNTSSDKATKILSNRANKTKEILDNLNKEILLSKQLIDGFKVTKDENSKGSKNLKQLHDNTFEIFEDVTEKEMEILKNKSLNKSRITDEEERENMTNAKLKNIKEFKNIKESPLVLSVVTKKTNHNQTEACVISKNLERNNESRLTEASPLNNLQNVKGKKKDTIDSDINPRLIEKIQKNLNKGEDITRRSYFYNEEDNDI